MVVTHSTFKTAFRVERLTVTTKKQFAGIVEGKVLFLKGFN